MTNTTDLNLANVAVLLGVSERTVKDNVRYHDLPFIIKGAKGKPWVFDKNAVLSWSEKRKRGKKDESLDEAKLRKEIALATAAEISVEKELSNLVPINEVTKIIGQEYTAIRNKLLNLPYKLASVVYKFDDVHEIEEIILEEINEVLEALQQDNIDGDIDED